MHPAACCLQYRAFKVACLQNGVLAQFWKYYYVIKARIIVGMHACLGDLEAGWTQMSWNEQLASLSNYSLSYV